ncbi:MAG: hypothetical protein J1F11_08670 [Oscillospiraceae bacterium]|nr:hypothetical protein [Oscillospiraceae bacterium]
MIEIQLTAIFFACAVFLTVSGLIIIHSENMSDDPPRVFIILPVNKDTSDIEFIVRSCVYPAAGQHPESVVMLCDQGADKDTLRIFEKLMNGFCRYCIIKLNDNDENVCKILNSMV